jgi:gamma-glutamyltranspeptidase/glutathione hydrolase
MITKALACPEPVAAQIGGEIFNQGGSAVDGAVAAAFGQAVTNSLGCGIGGTAFVLMMRPGWAAPRYLNAQTAIGSLAGPDIFEQEFIGRSERVGRYLVRGDANSVGYRSIMTPGFVLGMARAHDLGGGRLKWNSLVSPSAQVAAEGFDLYPYLETYYTFEGPDRPGYPDVFRKLAHDPGLRERYLPGGRPPRVGYTLRQPDYGRTLERIGDGGAKEFYVGAVGREMASDLAAHGAFVTSEDLATYRVKEQPPVKGTFRELTVYSSPPPAHGLILLTMLNLAEGIDWERMEWNGPDYLETIAWATRSAFTETIPYIGDPDFVNVPIEWLASKERLKWVQQSGLKESAGKPATAISEHTTHVTSADLDGNVVSITHSIGSVTGSGVVTAGMGFFYNNFMGHFNPLPGYHDSIVPGKRMGGGCPTIVFRGDRPWFAIGSSGGSRLISGIFQTILNAHLHSMSLQEAVSAPRIHSELGRKIYAEPALPDRTVQELQRRGYDVEITEYMACNQCVGFSDEGLEAGSDPRGGMGIARFEGLGRGNR